VLFVGFSLDFIVCHWVWCGFLCFVVDFVLIPNLFLGFGVGFVVFVILVRISLFL